MQLVTYLQQKPLVGAASGIGGGLITFIVHLLTDDYILKLVSGLAAWAGLIVVLLTLAIKVIVIFKNLTKKMP